MVIAKEEVGSVWIEHYTPLTYIKYNSPNAFALNLLVINHHSIYSFKRYSPTSTHYSFGFDVKRDLKAFHQGKFHLNVCIFVFVSFMLVFMLNYAGV